VKIIQINGLPDRGTQSSVMALGNFDGIHIGHQQLIGRAVELAGQLGVPASVLTFYPHPRQVLGNSQAHANLLTPYDEKMRVLERFGVQVVYVVQFTLDFAALTAEEFVFGFLSRLNPQGIVVGFDYAFGRGGKSDASQLKELAAEAGIPVEIIGAVNRYGEKVSSTLIREKLSYGDARLVCELLGRPYAIVGTVVHGEKRGRLLGFPTANIDPLDSFALPKNGVYAVRVWVQNEWHAAVLNIGTKPTFHDQAKRTLEAHLLDFSGDLYGEAIRVEFLDFLRDEKKFFSVEELVAQIRSDVQEARLRLAFFPA
jgi:riboflavin kinase/FMN adenylyltransferase